MSDLGRYFLTHYIHILNHGWVCIKYLKIANQVIFNLDDLSFIL